MHGRNSDPGIVGRHTVAQHIGVGAAAAAVLLLLVVVVVVLLVVVLLVLVLLVVVVLLLVLLVGVLLLVLVVVVALLLLLVLLLLVLLLLLLPSLLLLLSLVRRRHWRQASLHPKKLTLIIIRKDCVACVQPYLLFADLLIVVSDEFYAHWTKRLRLTKKEDRRGGRKMVIYL